VFNYLPFKVGETMTDEKAAQTIRTLFATGFFQDVRLEVEKDVLIILVEERPAIAAIDFVGLKELKPGIWCSARMQIVPDSTKRTTSRG
jgi:outer membrane protein insertion porin family